MILMTIQQTAQSIIDAISGVLTDYVLVSLLMICGIYFTVKLRFVQFRMVGEMFKLLFKSGKKHNAHGHDGEKAISSFQAFTLSIASRVGTGNMAGVATAVAVGGPGAVFWMWMIALIGGASAFVESTLAQLFKVKGEGSFRGGPAYYIYKGLHNKAWAILFAILITLTFGLAYCTVQANTIADAFNHSFGIERWVSGLVITILMLAVIWGSVQSISRFSQWVVPFMAIAYILLAVVIIAMNITKLPSIIALIVENAIGVNQALGGSLGMAIIMGVKRGLFSNEAGEGSTPNAAATASVSHPVKQGLIQALGVYTDTLFVCTATAFIILCSGVYQGGDIDGIALTQRAIDSQLPGSFGSTFVSVAIFFFAFTSIIANYYYGETNLLFIKQSKKLIYSYRLIAAVVVFASSIASLEMVWGLADITMAMMTICNLAAIVLLGKYAVKCLKDYRAQLRKGLDPHYKSSTIPEIAEETEAWSNNSIN
jgi:AGCS family alanine or glycine:cation symporter